MKKSVVAVLSSCAFLAFAGASNADFIKYNGVFDGSSESVGIVGSYGYLGGGSYTGGVYTGLYSATNLTTKQTWLTYCIDPIGEISPEDSWNANLITGSQLATGTAGVLSTPAYGSTTAAVTTEKYEMIGYLANKYYYDLTAANPMVNSYNTSTEKDKRSDLSLAFWEIARDYNGTQASLNLSGDNFKAYGSLTFAQSLLDDAYTNHGSTINMMVYSPTTRHSQEFIAISVPEPGSFILFGTGLLSLFGLMAVRRKKN
jgi:hypothetical protein